MECLYLKDGLEVIDGKFLDSLEFLDKMEFLDHFGVLTDRSVYLTKF